MKLEISIVCDNCKSNKLKKITYLEQTLMAINNKRNLYVYCEKCNGVSIVQWTDPTYNTQLIVKNIDMSLEEFIKDSNNNMDRVDPEHKHLKHLNINDYK